jgi:hypothetical protein
MERGCRNRHPRCLVIRFLDWSRMRLRRLNVRIAGRAKQFAQGICTRSIRLCR